MNSAASYFSSTLDGIIVGIIILSTLVWITYFIASPKRLYLLGLALNNISLITYCIHLPFSIVWPIYISTTIFLFAIYGDLYKHLPKTIKILVSVGVVLFIGSILIPILSLTDIVQLLFLFVLHFWLLAQLIIWIICSSKINAFKISITTYGISYVGILIEILRQASIIQNNYFTCNAFEVALGFTVLGTLLYFLRYVDHLRKSRISTQIEKELLITQQNTLLEKKVEERTRDLEIEKKKSEELLKKTDELLLNILPKEIAEELRQFGSSKAKAYSMVTVMFTDFVKFSEVSEKVSAELLVEEIDYCFSAFDSIIQRYNVEKIKTVGDAYLCVGGMPILTFHHAIDTINAAIEIRDFIEQRKREKEGNNQIPFEIRIGIHTGPVVAGIVGKNKFAYDIWGDTVNIAARMEQHSEVGKINISGTTYQLVKDKFQFAHRGKIEAKNKGAIDMYFVEKL